ncbi:5'-3' exonuclease [uncultured Aeromicrobium sp.]|uniref:5'-3' exonuclease n=1 Tax=uncultured Aeromicrobium sp. TaxID=337820 RepID=UPI0025DDB8A1|nr:5'-3' exonuclease [uncultured Aeromicrobium sp.]
MSGRLILLDSASLYFRAYFGVPDSLKAPDGTPVNAVRGFLDFVAALSARYEPASIVACWDDDWRPQWRVDLLPSYKAHRVVEDAAGVDVEEVPDALGPQVPVIAEALELLGIPVIGAPAAEADDVIGTLVHRWDGPIDVVTGDRDLFQVVDDARGVRVLYTARGVGKHEVVDASWVRTKYSIEPRQYVDFAVMRGDASDGLPGVAGIGEKTASTLLAEYGDLDVILAAAADNTSDLRPRVRRSLLDAAGYITSARQVVRVCADLDLDTPQTLAKLSDDEAEVFADFGKRWGLGGAADRVLASRHPQS